jgi:hypothetical protein
VEAAAMTEFEAIFVYDHEAALGIVITSPDGKGFEAFTISSMCFLGCRPTKAEAATLVLDNGVPISRDDQ